MVGLTSGFACHLVAEPLPAALAADSSDFGCVSLRTQAPIRVALTVNRFGTLAYTGAADDENR